MASPATRGFRDLPPQTNTHPIVTPHRPTQNTTGPGNRHPSCSYPGRRTGPAGHFDLTKLVVDGYDLGISGLPIGAVAADALVTFTVHFSREMPIGETFEGLLLYGPPEAPSMKQVPVTIERLMEVATELYLPLITKG